MRAFLILLFSAVLAAMLAITTVASLDRGVLTAAAELWPDPWFKATLLDAYFGFLTVYVWIAYRERSWSARALWFALLMGLGNIAIAVYVLRALVRLGPGEPLERLLLRPAAEGGG